MINKPLIYEDRINSEVTFRLEDYRTLSNRYMSIRFFSYNKPLVDEIILQENKINDLFLILDLAISWNGIDRSYVLPLPIDKNMNRKIISFWKENKCVLYEPEEEIYLKIESENIITHRHTVNKIKINYDFLSSLYQYIIDEE